MTASNKPLAKTQCNLNLNMTKDDKIQRGYHTNQPSMTSYDVIIAIWRRHLCAALGSHLDLVQFQFKAEQLRQNSRERRQHDNLCDVIQ